MASATVWLRELGIPPQEVCLDWAWQIHRQTQYHQVFDSSTAPLRWHQVEVVEAGKIELTADALAHSPDELFKQLLFWSEALSQAYDAQELHVSKYTALNSIELIAELRRATLVAGNGTASIGEVKPSENHDASQIVALELQRPTGQRNRRRKTSSPSIAFIKQHRLTVLGLASAALVLVGWALLTGEKKRLDSRLQSSLSGKELLGADQGRIEPEDVLAGPHSSASSTPSGLSDDELIELPKFGESIPLEQSVSQITMPTVAAADLLGTFKENSGSIEESNMGSPAAAGFEREPISHAIESKNLSGLAEPSNGVSKNLSDRDVIGEVAELAKSVESKPTESELSVPSAENADTILEPLVLQTSPMIQTQKLPTKGGLRLKQPVWHIELSADDDFEVEPRGPQTISDRQVTTWFISDADSKTPRTSIMIQAQAAPGRQTAVRWRIGARAEDLPNLLLPLGKEILQPLQQRLRVFSQSARQESDRLKQISKEVGMEMRLAITQQGKIMETQSKLAGRVSTIVAESLLLDSLLRSQITVYATLLDGQSADAPVVLQFGDAKSHGTRAVPAATDVKPDAVLPAKVGEK